ncbi:hypothetical protein A2U01_0058342, partial [Trifolium medium]|nr:hypothetical protein [Trifolium medium]
KWIFCSTPALGVIAAAPGIMFMRVWLFVAWWLRQAWPGLRQAQVRGIYVAVLFFQPPEREIGEVFRVFHQQQG